MTERPVIKLDYEQDIYIKKFKDVTTRERLYKIEDTPEKISKIIAESLVDKDGARIEKLTPEFIRDNFTPDWQMALFLDIVEHNKPKKKLSLQQKKESGTI